MTDVLAARIVLDHFFEANHESYDVRAKTGAFQKKELKVSDELERCIRNVETKSRSGL